MLLLSVSLVGIPYFGFMAHLDNPGASCLEILTSIKLAKTIFVNKVIFTGSGVECGLISLAATIQPTIYTILSSVPIRQAH